MMLDAENQLSASQALTASGASTNVLDLRKAAKFGAGEPLAVLIVIETAADVANADETYAFKLQVDDAAAFSSPTDVSGASDSPAASALTAGAKRIILLPPQVSLEQYLRLYATLGGTTPSVTFSAWLVPLSAIENYEDYAAGYEVD